MIVAWLFVTYAWVSPILADQASCEAVKAAADRPGKCVQILAPAPSDKAHWFMPNKIGASK